MEPKATGPYTIEKMTKNMNYELRDATDVVLKRVSPRHKIKVVDNHNYSNPNGETLEVEKIIKHRTVKGGQYEYQVLWKKNQTKSWLKFEDFNSTKGISQYWRSKQLDLNCLILNQKKQKSEKLVFFERKENWIKKVFNLCIKLCK